MILVKEANCDIGDFLKDFRPILLLLDEIIYVSDTIISSVTIKHKQNSLKKNQMEIKGTKRKRNWGTGRRNTHTWWNK